MLGSHKRLLSLVLTVVSLLAMVAPAASAAPQSLQRIEITAPTNAGPAYLTKPDAELDVEFNILTQGTQGCDVNVRIAIVNQVWSKVEQVEYTYPYEDLLQAVNSEAESLTVGWNPDGWHNIEIEAREVGYQHLPPFPVECDKNVWTDTEVKAFLIDRIAPAVELVKPADDDWKGATGATGQDFLLVGTAEDELGLKDAWFELCPEGTSGCLNNWNSAPGDENWRAIGDVPADQTPGIPGQWQAVWDSTTVPDGFYFMRICAEDIAGNTNCADSREDLPLVSEDGTEHFNQWPDAHWVYVNNRVEIPLQVGWNLISTPLVLYDTDIEDVLSPLIDHDTVEGVWTVVWQGDQQVWKHWTPGPGPVDTLTKIVDGQGYFIKMKANDSLTFVGTWTTLGDGERPPEYPLHDGWNLIGYTHWGRPTIMPTDKVGDYLGGAGLIDNLQALFYYDPWTNVFKKLYSEQHMILGRGYWFCAENSVIPFWIRF